MGRRKKAETEADVEISSFRMPSSDVLEDLSELSAKCKGRAAQATQELRETLQTYVKTQGVDPAAFGLVDRFARAAERDPVRARVLWDHFLHYMDVLDIEGKMAPQLPGMGVESHEDEGPDEHDPNVYPVPSEASA